MTITNFAAGELSQNLKGRVDISQYYAGCQKLKNFEIIPTGGIYRRSGLQRIGKLHGRCRLIPFILDSETSFILEFTAKKIYIWKNGIPLKNKETLEDLYYNTDYELSEVNEIQYAQNYDTMYFVQENHKPYVLKYDFSQQDFTRHEAESFDFYVDVNLDDDYGIIRICENELPEDAKDGDWAVFKGKLYQYIKNKWEVNGTDPETDDELFSRSGKFPSCVTFYQNRLWFAGTQQNRQRIWASAAPDTEGTRYTKFGMYQKFVTVNKTLKEPDVHLFTADIEKAYIDKGNKTTILTNVSQDLREALQKNPTDYFVTNDTYVPIGTKVLQINESSIKINAALNIGSETKKQAIVFSLSLWRNTESASAEDYEFTVVNNNMTTPDVAFYLEPASEQNDAVKWLAPGNFLTVGTESNVWNIPAGANALNVAAVMNGRYGSDNIQAHVVDTAVIFFAQGKCGIREYYYNSQNEAFQTNNIAILSEQMLTESPEIDFDFMTNPYNRILITRADGSAVQLLYDKNNGVMAWNRIEHGGLKLLSCATVRGENESDLSYYAVEDAGEYYLERLDPGKKVFLDSWKEFTRDMDVSEYEEGKAILWNATTHKECSSVTDIPEDFINEGDAVYIGYKFESLILSMPVMTNDISSKKRIVNLYVRFNESYMPVMKTTGMPDEYFTGIIPPFSGMKKIDYPGASDVDVTFQLAISDPEPCNILCVDAAVV